MQTTVQKLKLQLNIIFTQKRRAYSRFQSNSTPAEYHRANTLISEINSLAHRVIKEAKGAKFVSLLKEVPSKSSTTSCDTSLGKRTVVTIPEDLLLNSAELSFLSKGTHVCRLMSTKLKPTVRNSSVAYASRLTLMTVKMNIMK